MYFWQDCVPAGSIVTVASENPEFGTTLARRLNWAQAHLQFSHFNQQSTTFICDTSVIDLSLYKQLGEETSRNHQASDRDHLVCHLSTSSLITI